MTATSYPYKRWEAVFFLCFPKIDCHAFCRAEGVAMIASLIVIAGMGKGFGNKEVIKSRNGDWEEKIF